MSKDSDRFLAAYREAPPGVSQTQVAQDLGYTIDHLRDWRRRVPGFKEATKSISSLRPSPTFAPSPDSGDDCDRYLNELKGLIMRGELRRLRETAAERAGVSLHSMVAFLSPSHPRFKKEFRERYDALMAVITAKVADRADWIAASSAEEVEEDGDHWKTLNPRLQWLSRRSEDYMDKSRILHLQEGTVTVNVQVRQFQEVLGGVAERFLPEATESGQILELPEKEEAMEVEFIEVDP